MESMDPFFAFLSPHNHEGVLSGVPFNIRNRGGFHNF